jgi:hypothetical protein
MSWRRPRAFALRLHVSAAPPRVGLTQALGATLTIEDAREIYREVRRVFGSLPAA